MSETARLHPSLRPGLLGAALATLGAGLSIIFGIAAGNPTPVTLMPALAVIGVAAVVLAFRFPFGAFLVIAASTILLLVYDLPGGQGLNPLDLLMPCVLIASLLGSARCSADAADRGVTDPRRQELMRATRRLEVSVIAFYVVAAVSILVMAAVGRLAPLAVSVNTLLRCLQGVLLFPLGIWWLRSESRIHMAMRAIIVGGVLVAVMNGIAYGMGRDMRAGMTWFVNQSVGPIGGPNEAASTMLLVIAVLLVRQTLAMRMSNLVLLALALAMLVATSSRSGLLAVLAFTAIVVPRARLRWLILAGAAVLAAVPFVPQEYWTRISRTMVLQKGTFEAYTSLIRFYGWKNAFEMFLDNPLLGVGYVAYPAVSGDYGELRIKGLPVDNFYLETASGMGVPGLIALALVIVRMFQLGAVVRRHAPAGSLAHVMGRYHTPLWIGMLIVNLTGNNFAGMVVMGQLALWSAMLIRSGHLAMESRAA